MEFIARSAVHSTKRRRDMIESGLDPDASWEVPGSKKRQKTEEGVATSVPRISAEPAAARPKRLKLAVRESEFWKKWRRLIRQTRLHANFQKWCSPPAGMPLPPGWRRAEEAILTAEEADKPCRIVAIATTTIYVGDLGMGFDPKHLSRVTAVLLEFSGFCMRRDPSV